MFNLEKEIPKGIRENHILAIYNIGRNTRQDDSLPEEFYFVIYEHTLDKFLSGEITSCYCGPNFYGASLSYLLGEIENDSLQFLELPYLIPDSINADFASFMQSILRIDLGSITPGIPRFSQMYPGYEFYNHQLAWFQKNKELISEKKSNDVDFFPEVEIHSSNYDVRRELITLRKKVWNINLA